MASSEPSSRQRDVVPIMKTQHSHRFDGLYPMVLIVAEVICPIEMVWFESFRKWCDSRTNDVPSAQMNRDYTRSDNFNRMVHSWKANP